MAAIDVAHAAAAAAAAADRVTSRVTGDKLVVSRACLHASCSTANDCGLRIRSIRFKTNEVV